MRLGLLVQTRRVTCTWQAQRVTMHSRSSRAGRSRRSSNQRAMERMRFMAQVLLEPFYRFSPYRVRTCSSSPPPCHASTDRVMAVLPWRSGPVLDAGGKRGERSRWPCMTGRGHCDGGTYAARLRERHGTRPDAKLTRARVARPARRRLPACPAGSRFWLI